MIPSENTKDRELYLHIIARCFLFRSCKWISPYGHPWFLDGWRIADELLKGFDLESSSAETFTRPDIFFSRIWERKPFAVFHCLEDENYTDQIISWARLLQKVESCTKDEQDFIIKKIIEYGNYSPSLHKLQQPEYSPQMSEEIGIGENGRGNS